MGDGDIHFPSGQRREKPKFEPPPWERDLFDELSKRKQVEAPVALEVAAAEPPVVEEEPGPLEELAAQPEVVGPKPAQIEADAEEAGQAEKPALDAKQVEVLLMGLRAEEPRPEDVFRRVTVIAGVVSALIGLALMTWGFIALATPKQSGSGAAFLVGMLLLFGIGLIGGGAWVVYTTLRQQGVL